jgi:hypothetical protein
VLPVVTTIPQGTIACGFATVNTGDWVNLNLLVVLFTVTVAGFVYAFANFLPGERFQKWKGYASYEMIEAVFSVIIIFSLFAAASFVCQAGGLMFGFNNYKDIFTSIDGYIGNLLFVNGLSLLEKLYATSIQYTVISKIAFFFLNQGTSLITGFLSAGQISGVTVTFGTAINKLFAAYAGIFTTTYGIFLGASFGGLFILFLIIPIIHATAMTVIAPIAMIFRSLSFLGPQLRKTSNLFLAMAIGFYFVLPLTVAMDSYIVSCMGIQGLGVPPASSPTASCYSYWLMFSKYTGTYSLPTMSVSLFNSAGTGTNGMNSTSQPSWASGQGQLVTTFYGSSLNLNNFFQAMFDAPSLAAEYGQNVAAYLFVSIVLLAIDVAITMGFIAGLARSLDAMSNLFGVGGLWQ